MIRVFSPNDKIFTSNGDAVIQPFKAKVHKEDNGDKGDKGDDGYTPIKGVDYFDGDKGEQGEQVTDLQIALVEIYEGMVV